MMSAEDNSLITRIGPGSPCGHLMRRYWQPAALLDELASPRPVRPVELLGEHLVLFRDDNGRYGLLARGCPHRGADLAFGRCEDGGLRCTFHGWLFDVTGQCLETPAEPDDSPLRRNIRQRAYPVVARGGILWAYMGPGEPPAFPDLDCFIAPDAYTFAFKGLWECNWLQAMEVGIDPVHASFLHRFFEDDARNDATQFRDVAADSDIPLTKLLRDNARPAIDVRPTEYGLRIETTRRLDDGRMHVRVTNQLFPHAIVIPLSQDMTLTQWHVPVDDGTCYWYTIFTSFAAQVDKAAMRAKRLEVYELPDYRSKKNRSNDYGFDPHDQLDRTYTGMGEDINVHDQWAVESQGHIQDRTREHLGTSDKAIIAYRRMLRQAIEDVRDGRPPPLMLDTKSARAIRGPVTIDGITPASAASNFADDIDRRRRASSTWGGALPGGPAT